VCPSTNRRIYDEVNGYHCQDVNFFFLSHRNPALLRSVSYYTFRSSLSTFAKSIIRSRSSSSETSVLAQRKHAMNICRSKSR
jgi:hypothetical protein